MRVQLAGGKKALLKSELSSLHKWKSNMFYYSGSDRQVTAVQWNNRKKLLSAYSQQSEWSCGCTVSSTYFIEFAHSDNLEDGGCQVSQSRAIFVILNFTFLRHLCNVVNKHTSSYIPQSVSVAAGDLGKDGFISCCASSTPWQGITTMLNGSKNMVSSYND